MINRLCFLHGAAIEVRPVADVRKSREPNVKLAFGSKIMILDWGWAR